SVAADTARINRIIEARVREQPGQYLWAHRRFKTRPEGEAGVYE
ncbi:MAG: lipid A biosynthesis acyltransferase, partial [Gammaproteobacteria bacterium]|nr:lipid A biosynthesis acyltransferase [Gammaproteobacteria bacterium]